MFCTPPESTSGEMALKAFRGQESGVGASFPCALPSPHALSLPGCQHLTAVVLPNTSLQGCSGAASLIQHRIFSRPANLVLLLSGGSTQRNPEKRKKSIYIHRVPQTEVVIGAKISLCSVLVHWCESVCDSWHSCMECQQGKQTAP